jgi:hypothetical protein
MIGRERSSAQPNCAEGCHTAVPRDPGSVLGARGYEFLTR